VGKRWTWVAWFLVAFFVVSMVATIALAVANGNNGGLKEPAGSLALLLGLRTPRRPPTAPCWR
jgi:hypothetical protein